MHASQPSAPTPIRRSFKHRWAAVRRYSWQHKLAVVLALSLLFALLDMLFFNKVTQLEMRQNSPNGNAPPTASPTIGIELPDRGSAAPNTFTHSVAHCGIPVRANI